MSLALLHPHATPAAINENEFPAFRDHFAPQARQEMLDEDLYAGRVVPLVLASVITAGVILALISVLITR